MSAEKKTSFQLLVYAWLLSEEEDFYLSVYKVKSLFSEGVSKSFCPKETTGEFASRLMPVMEGIFNPEVPFAPGNDVSRLCPYCPAKALCGR